MFYLNLIQTSKCHWRDLIIRAQHGGYFNWDEMNQIDVNENSDLNEVQIEREQKYSENFGLLLNNFYSKISDIVIHHYEIYWKCFAYNSKRNPINLKLNQNDSYRLFYNVLDKKNVHFKEKSIGYDGKRNVYFTSKLDQDSEDLLISGLNIDNIPCVLQITFKLINKIPVQTITKNDGEIKYPNELIKALKVMANFSFRLRMLKFTSCSTFPVHRDRHFLSNWIQIALGRRNASRIYDVGVTLLADKSALAFCSSGKALDFMNSIIKINFDGTNFWPTPYQILALDKAFKGVKVVTRNLGFDRVYKIHGISNNAANVANFIWKREDSTENVTVAEYFIKAHQTILKYPNLPCLVCGRDTLLPMEICEISPNQAAQNALKMLGTDYEANLVKLRTFTRTFRFTSLLQGHAQIRHYAFGNIEEISRRSSLRFNLHGLIRRESNLEISKRKFVPRLFHRTITFTKFGIINYCATLEEVENFGLAFLKQAKELNMMKKDKKIEKMLIYHMERQLSNVTTKNDKISIITRVIREAKASGCSFVICIFPLDPLIYTFTKKIADTKHCIVTQGVTRNLIKNFTPQTLYNVLSSINVKLGGCDKSPESQAM